jgi:hypothetical protein
MIFFPTTLKTKLNMTIAWYIKKLCQFWGTKLGFAWMISANTHAGTAHELAADIVNQANQFRKPQQ